MFDTHTADSELRLHCVQIAGGDVHVAEAIYDFVMKTAQRVEEPLAAEERRDGEAA